ncbi:MAG: hypothetical protein RL367_1897 [Pseudomonadota bacterium]|jgi:MOSC domain-containing protein YiiM
MPHVFSVSARNGHGLGKTVCDEITLIAGEGVAGDAHCGAMVKHRSRVAKDPTQPNLRQVHMIHAELLGELADRGFVVAPGELGENMLTQGLDLQGLATGTRLHIGDQVVVELTGLRNPCNQINGHSPGLMDALLERANDGVLIRKGGVMGIVVTSGTVRAGDRVRVSEPLAPKRALLPV